MAGTASKTALVLSAGGMFGAYQAGVWKVLAEHFEPDIIVGASIGAINGWAIAGGCDPDDLIERWHNLEPLPHQDLIRKLHSAFSPKIDCGVVATETFRLRPRLFRGSDLDWKHLAASTAVLGLYRQHRLDGRWCSDGGLLSALPLWAAVEMGAERIVAINALPAMPSVMIRKLVGALRAVSRFKPSAPAQITQIAPPGPLGSVKDMLVWKRENVDRWIAQGTNDAQAWLVAQAPSPAFSEIDAC